MSRPFGGVFGRKATGMTGNEIPDYLSGNEPRPELDVDDVAWIGVDGTGDFEPLLAERGDEPEEPLRLIVRAIVAGSGASGETLMKRETEAMAALTGTQKPGRPESDDYDLLLEIARRWLKEFWVGRRVTVTRRAPLLGNRSFDPSCRRW